MASKDIDILVNGLSGKEFAEYVVKYLREVLGEPQKDAAIISQNVEKSKHLETATINIWGQNIDFVAPRAEVYTDASRVPTIVPATVEQDASRRDLTINSLFMNLDTGAVEDFTGKGIEDLKNGIIRTPSNLKEGIDSKRIFLDDPLRCLRALRFATRFGFELDPELISAAKDPEVQESLRKKISRERVQDEVRKMLSGPDPVRATKLIKELGLLSYIFDLPEKYEDFEMEQNSPHHDFTVWDHTVQVLSNLQEIIKNRNVSDSDKFILNLAALLHDVGKLSPEIKQTKQLEDKIITTYHGHEAESMRAAEFILRNLPGTKIEEIEKIKKLIDGARRVNPQRCGTDQTCAMSRKTLGKFIREMGDLWEYAIDLGYADSAGHKKDQFAAHPTAYYDSMKEQIRSFDPKKIQNMRPLLNGDELMTIFNKKGGKWVGELIKELIDWQLENPEATKEQAVEFVKKLYIEKGLEQSASLSIRDDFVKQAKEQFPKKCEVCGRVYHAAEEFLAQPLRHYYHVGAEISDPGRQCLDDMGLEKYIGKDMVYRDCNCGSTLAIFTNCVHEDYVKDKDEANKYEREIKDPKWNKALISGDDRQLTRKQIRDHYVKNREKIMAEIKDKPIMMFLATNKNKLVLKRNHNEKPIIITNDLKENSGSPDNYFYWIDRRAVSFHRVFDKETDVGFIDLDLHDYSFSDAKRYAKEIAQKIKGKFNADAKIYESGGTGIHIEFNLEKKQSVDSLRHKLRDMCDKLNKEFPGATTGIVKDKGMRTDVSTLKNLGNIRVPGALNESTGKEKKLIADISRRAKLNKTARIDGESIKQLYELELRRHDLRQSNSPMAPRKIEKIEFALTILLDDCLVIMREIYKEWLNNHKLWMTDPDFSDMVAEIEHDYSENKKHLLSALSDWYAGIKTKYDHVFEKIKNKKKKELYESGVFSNILNVYKQLARGATHDVGTDMALFMTALHTEHQAGAMMRYFSDKTGISMDLLNDFTSGKFIAAELRISKRAGKIDYPKGMFDEIFAWATEEVFNATLIALRKKQKLVPEIKKIFVINIFDTDMWKNHEFVRAGWAKLSNHYKFVEVKIEPTLVGFGQGNWNDLALTLEIFNAVKHIVNGKPRDEVMTEVANVIKHELIHMMQNIMSQAKNIHYYARLPGKKDVLPGIGLPGKYDEKEYQKYTGIGTSNKKYNIVHSLSDKEFFALLQNSIDEFMDMVKEKNIAEGDMYAALKDFILSDHTIEALNHAGQTEKLHKYIRELYRAVNKTAQSIKSISSRVKEDLEENAWLEEIKNNPTVSEEKISKTKQVELWHGVSHSDALQKLPNGNYLLTPRPTSDLQKLWFVPGWNEENKQLARGYADYALVKIKIPFKFNYVRATKKNGEVFEYTESYEPDASKWERTYQVQEWYLYNGSLEVESTQVTFTNQPAEYTSSIVGEKESSDAFLRLAKKHDSAGIFIILPEKLAKQFPSLGEHDDSVPHITALYVGAVTKNKRKDLINIVKAVCEEQVPFEIKLDDKVTYFEANKHSDDCKVAKIAIISKELHTFHEKLKNALKEGDIKIDDHFPQYKPHTTLSYMKPPKEKFDDKIPSGGCKVTGVEIWGCGKNKEIEFGKSEISKRSYIPRKGPKTKSKNWWLSPSNELYEAPYGHREFIDDNLELFECKEPPCLYETAFDKNWIRIVNTLGCMAFTVPGQFSDASFRRIRDVLEKIPSPGTVLITDNKNVLAVPLSVLKLAPNVEELKKQIKPNIANVGVNGNSIEKQAIERLETDEMRDTLFEQLAQAQRGAPESAMLRIQHSGISNIYGHVCEHVGDLTHRMSEKPSAFGGQFGAVKEKVGKTLYFLTNAYGFEKEALEQVRTNLAFQQEEYNKALDETFDLRLAQLKALGKQYASAHQALTVYNEAQEHARSAAVAMGNWNFSSAVEHLMVLKSHLDQGREHWKEYALELDLGRVTKKEPEIDKEASKDVLKKYKSKREFDKTPEPEGKTEKGKNKHRFVIQDHSAKKAGTHFDLRLENDDGVMSSWAIPKARLPKGKEKLLAQEVEDHPISYNLFQGKIEEGYGAGTVKIHDSGHYEEIERTSKKIKFKFNGKKEKGSYVLINTDGKRWLILRAKDED